MAVLVDDNALPTGRSRGAPTRRLQPGRARRPLQLPDRHLASHRTQRSHRNQTGAVSLGRLIPPHGDTYRNVPRTWTSPSTLPEKRGMSAGLAVKDVTPATAAEVRRSRVVVPLFELDRERHASGARRASGRLIVLKPVRFATQPPKDQLLLQLFGGVRTQGGHRAKQRHAPGRDDGYRERTGEQQSTVGTGGSVPAIAHTRVVIAHEHRHRPDVEWQMSEELHGPTALTTRRPSETVRDQGDSTGTQNGRISGGFPAVDQEHDHNLGEMSPNGAADPTDESTASSRVPRTCSVSRRSGFRRNPYPPHGFTVTVYALGLPRLVRLDPWCPHR
ncbi:hypothetical protein SAMN05421507_112199 [Lentzea jiangxiensis]|uniref:Uncharacterized protein n=1 Tax=Lentzea jiangxiensis TaxID=641025 RepID=A0A1H0URJ1_9PSEU|nr:hypothetical protein SAMN05421507_112199 [Lentzea jiangxiensis]